MSPSKRIIIALRKTATIEDIAVRAQVRLLSEMRRAVLSAIAEASGYRLFHLAQLLSAIDHEVLRYRPAAEDVVRQATQDMFLLGTRMVDDVVGLSGRMGLHGFSPQLLQAVIEVTTDQVRSVWTELGSRLKTIVRRTSLGVTDPIDSMRALARAIRDPKTFGRVESRAETIIRTEVNRTFSLATQRRMEQSNDRLGGGLKKWWLTAEDSRVRPSHAHAGVEYGRKGSPGPIPVGKPFIVGGEELMFPRDPQGSAEETINCRCTSLPYVEGLEVAAAADQAA